MSNTLIYFLGCLSSILSCVFFVAIRWGHVCSPYAKYADKFFPARKISILLLLFSIVLFPYILNPMRTKTWMLVKFYVTLFISTTWIILFHKYFDLSGYKQGKYRLRLMASIPVLIVLLFFALSIIPKKLSEHQSGQVVYICIGAGASLFAYLVYFIFWLYRKTNEYNQDNYSNEEESLTWFANYVLWRPLAYTLTGWIVLFTDSQLLKTWTDLLFGGWYIIILLVSLHPNRGNAEAMQKMDEVISQYMRRNNLIPLLEDIEPENTEGISAAKANQIKTDTLEIVEQKKGFPDSHLTFAHVASQIDYGQIYVSKVLKQEFGGFYNCTNWLRSEYAAQYASEHPEASQDEMASQSGFSSRASQWRAANWLTRNEDPTV